MEPARPDATSAKPDHADAGPVDDSGAPAAANLLVIDGVTIIDGTGAETGRAVVIDTDSGLITAVVPAGDSWPAAQVVAGNGRFVVPALVDPHVHLTYSGATVWTGDPLAANLRASLYHGVTAVMDVGGAEVLFALREAISAGRVLGPTVRATGPFLTVAGSHPCERSPFYDCRFVESGDALAAAQSLVAAGADALKVALADAAFTPWSTPRLELAALAQITSVGLPVVAHVDSNTDTVDAVAAGVAILAHPVFSGPLSPDALQACKAASGVHSTLGAHAAVIELVDGQGLDPADPAMIVGAGVSANWQAIRANPQLLAPGYLDEARSWNATTRANVKRMCQQSSGVNLVPGSDAGYLFVPHGLGLQRELARLEALGCASPMELLDRATRGARELIGLPGGSVAPGEPAELLLLGADPRQGLAAALGSIEQVILGGRLFEREALRTIDLMQNGSAADGELCLEPADCGADLACDGLAHVCRPSCSEPFAAVNSCGQGAWCMPDEGLAGPLAAGVCRPEPGAGCDLYQTPSGCEQPGYEMTCAPLDHDTNGCRLAGAGVAGAVCSYTADGSTCAAGHYCSVIDKLCYRLCDPALDGGVCPPGTSCKVQPASATAEWFGLCILDQ